MSVLVCVCVFVLGLSQFAGIILSVIGLESIKHNASIIGELGNFSCNKHKVKG